MSKATDSNHPIDSLLAAFLKFDALGLKKEAKQAALAIVDALPSLDAKAAWTRKNLEHLPLNGKARIRHEIYRSIVFPSWKAAFDRGDAEASYLLGKYWQNLVADDLCYRQMDRRTERDFFRIAFEADPKSSRYQQAYLASLVRGLQYAFHEWPAGILIDYTNWQAELSNIKTELSLVQLLDTESEYTDDLVEWIKAAEQYERRLSEKSDRY